jgi:uncharacterized protein (DUF1800 family)
MSLPPLGGGPLGRKRAAHLLRRATFGATKDQIDTFANRSAADAVADLFRPSTPLTDPLPPIDPKTGVEWISTPITDANSEDSKLQEFFKGWFVGQMMAAGVSPLQAASYSAREKVVMFLHTHFTCIQSKVSNSKAMYYQNVLFRMFALDDTLPDEDINFKKLTVKVSIDNAMLRLLDGNLNVKGGVNENYARELLELYSIGRGLESFPPPTSGEQGDYGVYTEDDVKTAARILTGWNIDDDFLNEDPITLIPRGIVKGGPNNASSHDNDITKPKKFSDRFVSVLFPDNTITPDPLLMPNGVPTELSAEDEINKLIELIYEQPETLKNICRKIYRFFVWAPHTDDEVALVESEVIPGMVDTFKTNGFKIQFVIEDLLRSRHFYDGGPADAKDDNYGGLIKSPLDLTLGTLRFFEVPIPDMTTSPELFYQATDQILRIVQDMGMNFYEPYDVAGYEAYHQFPIYHRFWITTNSISKRYEFIRRLISPPMSGGDLFFNVNTYDFIRLRFPGQAPDALTLLRIMIEYLLPHTDNLVYDAPDDTSSLTYRRMAYFKARFLSDIVVTDPEAYWTSTWTTGTQTEEIQLWLNTMFDAVLQSPEYQLS